MLAHHKAYFLTQNFMVQGLRYHLNKLTFYFEIV